MNCAIKYKPMSLAHIIYPDDATKAFIKAVATGALTTHIIFYGPNGTGKTTVADLLPFAISGDAAMVESKDYSELLDQKDLKTYLKTQCQLARLTGNNGRYYLVLHEFDNANKNLAKLWMALDACADYLTLFITTNNPMLIHKSIRSRCREIEFPAVSVSAILPRARKILASENARLSEDELAKHLSVVKNGDLRSYFRKLDDLIYLYGAKAPPKPPTFQLSLK
tara:strand:+ start:147050 stop:147721 length:672 start_codon:yes stop_codon:yes gene_type:complete